MKDQYNQLEDDSKMKQETINRLNYEISNARQDMQERYQFGQDQEAAVNRINSQLVNYKNRYQELEE